MSETPPAAIVYAKQLTPKGHGLPLWYPEPTRSGEILIGDVGYISSGRFLRLFNATRPASDDINGGVVPEGFIQLRYPEDLEQPQLNYLDPCAVYNSLSMTCTVEAGISVNAPKLTAGGKYTFACRTDRAAIAMLGGPGHCFRVEDNKFFREYIAQHHESWYEFARTRRGLMISPESIVLVYGCVKTSHWALAASASDAASHEISFEVPSGSFASAVFRTSISNNSAPAVDQRSGPKDLNGVNLPLPTIPEFNQCLFLRYYKVKTRWLRDAVILNKIEAHDAQSTAPGATSHTPSASPNASITERKMGSGFLGTLGRFVKGKTGSPRTDENPSKKKHPLNVTTGNLDLRSGKVGFDGHIETVPSIDPIDEVYDKPLDDILEYILAQSEARSAVVSHDDLYNLFPDSEQWPLDVRAHLGNLQPRVLLDDSTGVARLVLASHDHELYQVNTNATLSPLAQSNNHQPPQSDASKVTEEVYRPLPSSNDYDHVEPVAYLPVPDEIFRDGFHPIRRALSYYEDPASQSTQRQGQEAISGGTASTILPPSTPPRLPSSSFTTYLSTTSTLLGPSDDTRLPPPPRNFYIPEGDGECLVGKDNRRAVAGHAIHKRGITSMVQGIKRWRERRALRRLDE